MSREKQIEEMAFKLWELMPISLEMSATVATDLYNAGYRKIPENIGEFSDGYHTFNELYHHRAVLFSVICNMFPEKSWKSKLHDTGDMYDGMFIVGIETEQGQATYHYDIEPYWDMFKVKELEKAPKYDGHTPSDAIARIGNLPCDGYRKQEWISVDERLPDEKSVERLQWDSETLALLDVDTDMVSDEVLVTVIDYEHEEMVFVTTDCTINGQWARFYEVTHWMPLPEPPKMKGEKDNDSRK